MDVKMVVAVMLFVFFIVKSRLITKLLNFIRSSTYYKIMFARMMKNATEKFKNKPNSPLFHLKKAQFEEIEKKLEELPGDVLEIGAGSGPSLDFLRLPQGCSMVVVDYNPHFEQHFREKLAKHPDIKLKEYLVQSAADMSNIPDDSFSAVFVTDVLCSIDENLLRNMLKEVKRVLKPNGCFYFLEHVLDNPGTLRRIFQKLICWLSIWQCMGDGCRCDKETWLFIQETGFKSVTMSYSYVPMPRKKFESFDKMFFYILTYFIRYFLRGHARK